MQAYLDLIRKVQEEGVDRSDGGIGADTRSIFSAQMRFNLKQGFPLLTVRPINFTQIAAEILWCIKGDTNINYLHKYGITKWDSWSDASGYAGPVYGAQWRRWECADSHTVDQLRNLISQIKFNPFSRRLLLSSWNLAFVDQMWVAPTNVMLQFYVSGNVLSSQLMQRSSDLYTRVPETIASYSLLTHLIAKECGLEVGEFIWIGGDVHLYHNNLSQVQTLLERAPRKLPQLKILRDVDFIDQYEVDDFAIEGYEPYDAVPAMEE